jgi:hypothetical protein
MSGVVNKQVAEKAFSVKADELIRKPFQPQDLITRVRHLLRAEAPAPVAAPAVAANAHAALSSIFQQPSKARGAMPATSAAPAPVFAAAAPVTASAPMPAPARPTAAPPAAAASASASADVQKLRFEILRLESLVKKLQSDLSAERDYSRALEEHVKTLQEND